MKEKLFSRKNILFLILAIALFVRTVSVFLFMYKYNIKVNETGISAYPPLCDSGIYYHTAMNIIEGKGYSIIIPDGMVELPESFKPSNIPNTYYHNFYPPLYPLFLSGLFYIFGKSILSYAIPQIILGTICCYLIYSIARDIFSLKVGLLAGFFLAIYPQIIWWTSYIRSENLFIPLQLLTILFLVKAVRNNFDLKKIALSGFFLAASFSCRNVILYLPIFIACYFALVFFRVNKKQLISGIAIFLLSFYIPLLSWAYRNYTVYNQFTITTIEDWDSFYCSNNLQTANLPFFSLYELMNENIKLESSVDKKNASIVFVREYPFKYLKLCAKRFIAFWGPITKKQTPLNKIVSGFFYVLIFPASFFAFYRSKWWLKENRTTLLLITIILYYTVIHSLVCVEDYLVYRLPIIPLVCIFSAFGYSKVFSCTKV